KNVGVGKTVTVSGITIAGADAGNYTLTNTTATTTANITAKSLTVSATADNKAYDGNTTAGVHLTTNALAGDVVTASDTGATFADKNVGVGKTVMVSGITIGGADAGNYTLSNTTATAKADITAATSLPKAFVNPLSLLEGLSGLTSFVFQVKLPYGGSLKGPVTFAVF